MKNMMIHIGKERKMARNEDDGPKKKRSQQFQKR
jgi:hypothetical protein